MDGKKPSLPDSPTAGTGLTQELQNLKVNGSASVAELREFLKSLKARNPQEVIGIVSSHLLVQSLGLACVAMFALIAVFTIGPYMIYGPRTAKAPAVKPTVEAAAIDASRSASEGGDRTGASATGAAASGQPDAARAAQVMGLDEVKSADPKENPLDKPDIDKLLDGL
jgi:hypothetical protein